MDVSIADLLKSQSQPQPTKRKLNLHHQSRAIQINPKKNPRKSPIKRRISPKEIAKRRSPQTKNRAEKKRTERKSRLVNCKRPVSRIRLWKVAARSRNPKLSSSKMRPCGHAPPKAASKMRTCWL